MNKSKHINKDNTNKIVHKTFAVWQHEKEEQWLNQMSAEGWQLVKASPFRYEFTKGEKNFYQYRLEMLPNSPKNPESQRYIEFMEETGAEYLDSMLRWVYFRRRTADGPFEIFSDTDSKISHFNRINTLLILILICELLIGGANLLFGITAHSLLNSVCGILCLVLAVFIICGYLINRKKIKKLLLERIIHE